MLDKISIINLLGLVVLGSANHSFAQAPQPSVNDAKTQAQAEPISLSKQFETFETNSNLSLNPPSSQPLYLEDIKFQQQTISANETAVTESDYLEFDNIKKSDLSDEELEKIRRSFIVKTKKKEDPRYKPVLGIRASDSKLEIK